MSDQAPMQRNDSPAVTAEWLREQIGDLEIRPIVLCRNRRCVNPAHLEPVTNAENGRRGRTTRLSADDVRAIRASTDSAASLAARYGVARSTIYGIRNRHSWKDIAC